MTALAIPLPPSTRANVESIESVSGVWWAVYCKSRQEKAFVGDMEDAGIPAYCPTTAYWGIKDGRRQLIHRPTFTGYAFFAARGDKETPSYAADVYAAKANKRTVTFLEIRDQKQFVRELAQIQRALAIDPELNACGCLVPGRRVRITRGKFMGMEGKLESHSKGIVHLTCSILQSGVEVQIDAEDVEPV